jgi:site-specific DNA recombinase
VVLEEIERRQVEVVFILGGVAHTDEERMALQMRGVFAEYERAKIRERTRRGRLHRARSGAPPGWSNPPYGLRCLPGDEPHRATVAIEECEATVVRLIFAWIANNGLRLRQVALRLDQRGVKPRTARRWAANTIAAIVHNPVYMGRAYHQKYESVEPHDPHDRHRYRRRLKTSARRRPEHEWIGVPVPAIVDEALWRKAQQRLIENRRQTAGQVKHPYLLRGLLFCAACGRKMWGFGFDFGTRCERRYYGCNVRDRLKPNYERRCPRRPVRAEDVEQVVWDDLARWLQEPEQLATQLEAQRDKVHTVLEAYATEQRRLAREMRSLMQSIERLVDAYQVGAITIEELRARRERLEQSKQHLQASIAQTEQEHQQALARRHVVDELRQLKERLHRGLERCSWEDRRAIVELLIEKIEVAEPHLRVHYIVPLGTSGHGSSGSGTPSTSTPPERPGEPDGSRKAGDPDRTLYEPCPCERPRDHGQRSGYRGPGADAPEQRQGAGVPRLGTRGARWVPAFRHPEQ